MGRKSKYSLALQERICEALIEGNTIESICSSVNITKTTFYDWISTKPAFSNAIKKAEEKRDLNGELLAVHHIFKKMEDHWQAAAWWLERRFPNKYRNVQETKDGNDYEKMREQLTELLENAPKRAENS